MAYSAAFQWSNAEDQSFDLTATSADTGDDIDFSTATAISFVIGDVYSCPLLTASLANGLITVPVATTIEVSIPASSLQVVCPGTHKVGMTYELNGSINQLIYGTISIYDGISRI